MINLCIIIIILLLLLYLFHVTSQDIFFMIEKLVLPITTFVSYGQYSVLETCDESTNIHTVYNYIFVSVTPQRVSMVKPPSSGGTKGHRLHCALKVVTLLHIRNNPVCQYVTIHVCPDYYLLPPHTDTSGCSTHTRRKDETYRRSVTLVYNASPLSAHHNIFSVHF
jgi:hypothetical protein